MTVEGADTLVDLIAEFERQTSHVHEQIPVALPVAERPRNGRLAFSAPPPTPAEPSFLERTESALKPLRERVENAEYLYKARSVELEEAWEQKMAEAEQALKRRHDLEAAMASIHNVSTQPPPPPKIDTRALVNMSSDQYRRWKEENGLRRYAAMVRR
jgi:hypothetical protein